MGALLLGFASYPHSRGNACKIGNVFPEHFYAGLLHLACNPPDDGEYSFIGVLLQHDSTCRVLALHDKNGLADGAGNLLFDLECLREELKGEPGPLTDHDLPFSVGDLYKIWKLMNHYEDFASIREKFDINFMRECIGEEFVAMNAFPEGMLEKFRRELNLGNNRARIPLILKRYMYEQYYRQAEPLEYVAKGFQSILRYLPPGTDLQTLIYQQLVNANEAMGLRDIPWAAALSNVIQGPPFTRTAFDALIDRSVVRESPIQEEVRVRMHVIRDWYRSNAATDAQRKEMLRCMNGTDVIITDMRPLEFDGPAKRSDDTPDPYSRFHTCFGSVDLGTELMELNPVEAEGRNALINTWLNHIAEAMRAGISIR